MLIAEGSLEVKLPTVWTDEKAEVGRVREEKRREEKRREKKRREEEEERRSEKRKSQKTEDAGARKGSKVAKHCVFPMICGSGGSKSRRVRSHLARGEMKNCTPLWREAHSELKMHKTPKLPSTFKS